MTIPATGRPSTATATTIIIGNDVQADIVVKLSVVNLIILDGAQLRPVRGPGTGRCGSRT
ncbi:MAG: hypothetical protein WCF12_00875 [Propionicimonas sp.]